MLYPPELRARPQSAPSRPRRTGARIIRKRLKERQFPLLGRPGGYYRAEALAPRPAGCHEPPAALLHWGDMASGPNDPA